jgi:GNAT superfamily N-acetyltransferase
MIIRTAQTDDLNDILEIFDGARSYMRSHGNMVQWTNGYPGGDVVLQDIAHGCCYVCTDGGAVVGVFSLIPGEDPTYAKIYDGAWLNDDPYGTVHRIAVGRNARKKGVAAFCLDWCLEKCRILRIDTHEDNVPMRSLLEKSGFQYCGVIYLPDGSPRLAFQKTSG